MCVIYSNSLKPKRRETKFRVEPRWYRAEISHGDPIGEQNDDYINIYIYIYGYTHKPPNEGSSDNYFAGAGIPRTPIYL